MNEREMSGQMDGCMNGWIKQERKEWVGWADGQAIE